MKQLLKTLFYVIVFLGVLFSNYKTNAQTGNIIVPSGNSGFIYNISLDKQGKYLYTVDLQNIVMWDAKTHEQLYSFPTNKGTIDDFTINNDGTKIAVAGEGKLICYSTVTGKQLFQAKGHYSCVTFNADDTKIYTVYDGIVAIDLRTFEETQVLKNDFDTYKSKIVFLDTQTLLIYNTDKWIKYNLKENKILFTYQFEKENFRLSFIFGIQCLVMASGSGNIIFRDINSGNIVKTIPMSSQNFNTIESDDYTGFIISEKGFESSKYTIYNNKFNQIKILNYSKTVDYAYYLGSKNIVYLPNRENVSILNIQTNSITSPFKKQIADLGRSIFNSSEYNYSTGILNLISGKGEYRSINLVKLMPFRNQKIGDGTDIISFSATGDTIANFEKGYIKNIKTGKIILANIKYLGELGKKESFFFSKNGNFAYFDTFNVSKQIHIFYRVNLKTGLSEQLFTSLGPDRIYIHPDKDLIAARDMDAYINKARVWNVLTGKLIFDKDIPRKENFDHITISADKKKILLVFEGREEIYSLNTGLLLETIKINANYFSATFRAKTNDLSKLVIADDYGKLRALDNKGDIIFDIKAHTATIRNIFFSPNDKIMYTLSEDQTIKVWETETGRLYGTLYLFEGNEFVFLDQYGRFDGTTNAIKRMYYFRDRVKISLDVVYEKFYTPNLYQRLITGEKFEPINMIISPSPIAKISYEQKTRNLIVQDDKPSYVNTTGLAEITINAAAENDKIDEIRLFHNGKAVNLATRGLFVTDNTVGTDSKKYTINLLPGQNTFKAIALNSQRTESLPDEIVVNYQNGNQPVVNNNIVGAAIDKVDKNATLHLIVVGINKYENEKLSLNYALADATAFKTEIEKDAKTVLGDVKTYFVTDVSANKKGITDAFAAVQKSAKPQDVFVFYYAGHGVISATDKEFYLVPTDVADLKNVDEVLKQKGISAKILQNFAVDIQAQKQLFILDACQSAGAFEKLLAADGDQQKSLAVVSRSTGTHWMAASGSQQFANEFSSLGHGAFTYVLLQALKGEAANNKMITVNGLKNFLQIQVPVLMKKYNGSAQYPASYGFGNDFPVQILN